MSKYNRSMKRGLSGIKGLNFAYRLNTWGPANGPSMLPANAFGRGYVPTPMGSRSAGLARTGLASPFTWLEGVFGVEAPADILSDALTTLANIDADLSAAAITIQTNLNTAQGFDQVTGADIQAKAQACEAEAAGLQSNLSSLQNASQAIRTTINTLSGTTDKTSAQTAKDAASALSDQVSSFKNSVSQLVSDVAALVKYAQAGPSVTQGIVNTLENTVTSSASTLTWIVAGGGLIYFLLPTFLPRLAGGIRKARG